MSRIRCIVYGSTLSLAVSLAVQAAITPVAQWHVDFDTSMGKGSHEYEKKFKDPYNRRELRYLRDLYEKNNLSKVQYQSEVKIPRIIHQIWVGNKPLPRTYKKLKRTWIKHHPGWTYRLWTNREVRRLKLYNQRFYDEAVEPAEKANILRYELLDKFGGLYCDVDFECLRSFEPLHHCYDFYTGLEPADSNHMLNNALIACAPGHPIMKHCIRTIKYDMDKPTRFYRNGVGHFSRAFTAVAHEYPGITVAFPASYFYPLRIHYSKKPIINCLKPESFAVHYWANQHGEKMPRLNFESYEQGQHIDATVSESLDKGA